MREKDQETQVDIIAEMRMGNPVGPCAYRIGLPDKEEVYESGAKMRITMIKNVTVQELADRLEATEKRKKAQHGNAAKMREALATLRKRFDNNTMAYQDRYFKFSGWHWHKKAKEAARWRDVFHELREVCDAALSAPARNCDKMPDIDNLTMHDLANSPCKSTLEYASREELLALARWLLTPAAEREGGNE